MSTTSDGYDGADSVPAGTVIERVYFTVPGLYTEGPPFDTYAKALAAGIIEREVAVEASREANGGTSYVGEHVTIDVRWKLTYPQGGGMDTVARRDRHETLADAREHLANIEKYSETGR